ncbi:MAG TPA: cyclic nucleotide-binding domain-containing protein [Polyangiaceae bacterium]
MSDPTRDLKERVERQVLACIGCNDCILSCPLPQAKEVSIADLNSAVDLPTIDDPRVVDFLSACTQCQQCVPACPADLSRADIVLYNKMKVEDALPNYNLMLQVGATVVQSPWTLDGLAEMLRGVQLFEGVQHRDLRHLVLKVTVRQLAPREVLFREGDFADRMCIVLSGVLEQWLGAGGRQVHVLDLGPGSFFGEISVMADRPEPYTVMAREPSVVIEIPKAAVHRLMGTSDTFKKTMNELYRRRALFTYARSPSALGGMPEQAVDELLRKAELKVLAAGEPLAKEGNPSAGLYLVRTGFLRVSRKISETEDQVLVYFREGDMFGAYGVLAGERALPYSVTAASRAEVIFVSTPHLFETIGRWPQARPLLEQSAQRAEEVVRSALWIQPVKGAAKDATRLAFSAEAMIERGLATGTEVLIVDQTKCTGCQNCVDACGRRHKHSRLQLRGLQMENYLFPTACRHCEDPVCLLCSVNGIVRQPTGEISIVEDNCIGCGACAERCPYGNISMHAAVPEEKGFFVNLLDFLAGGRRKEEAMAKLSPKTAKIAAKCDLCAGYNDYACVTACPTGAAFRSDPMKAFAAEALVVGLEMKRS